MADIFDKFCWYEAGRSGQEGTSEEAYRRIVDWASRARGTNPDAFDGVSAWLSGADAWSEQELAENGKIFREKVIERFLCQTRTLRTQLRALEPSGIVNQAVFGALDELEEELSGRTRIDWLKEAVELVFRDFSYIRDPKIREKFAGGLTGSAGTDTVEIYGYVNGLKDRDAGVQWTLFMPDLVKAQQNGFRVESFTYRKQPAMRFIGMEGDISRDSPVLADISKTLDAMEEYRCGFDYDMILVHHLGRGVDVERCHCVWGRFMKAGTPVPEGYTYIDFVPDSDGKSGVPYLSQFAFARFAGDMEAMHESKGFDCDGMYDVTRNIILGQNVIIPYPEKYWTGEVFLEGFGKGSTAYLFSVEKEDI